LIIFFIQIKDMLIIVRVFSLLNNYPIINKSSFIYIRNAKINEINFINLENLLSNFSIYIQFIKLCLIFELILCYNRIHVEIESGFFVKRWRIEWILFESDPWTNYIVSWHYIGIIFCWFSYEFKSLFVILYRLD
jgi:hypothetical protein